MRPIVYRYRNVLNGTYLFTASEKERDSLEADPNFVAEGFEGQSFRAEIEPEIDPMTITPFDTVIPQEVFRFRRKDNGSFFYTISDEERDFILNDPSVKDFYQIESESFFAYENPVTDSIPVFRFFNPNLGAHLYTPNEKERDFILDTPNSPWTYEPNSTFYAFPLSGIIESKISPPLGQRIPPPLVGGRDPYPLGRRSPSPSKKFRFKLSPFDETGALRKPQFQQATATFTFSRAIENFTGRFSDDADNFNFGVINITDRFASEDDPAPRLASPITLDLTARYLPKDSVITLPDGESPDEFISDTQEVAGADRIEYILTSEDFNDLGINEFTLILEDSDSNIDNGFQVVVDDEGLVISDSRPDLEGFQRNFLDENGQEVEQTIDLSDQSTEIEGIKIINLDFQQDAISNIEHIVDNGLLELFTKTRVTGLSSVESDTIVSIEDRFIDLDRFQSVAPIDQPSLEDRFIDIDRSPLVAPIAQPAFVPIDIIDI